MCVKTTCQSQRACSVVGDVREDEDTEKGGKTFTDIATEAFATGDIKASGIAFDVSQFKARREV